MLEELRKSVEKRLKEKGVSLIMMFNQDGEILWHSGRRVRGNTIEKGIGFSKTACMKAMKSGKITESKEELLNYSGDGLSETAFNLRIKHILILPINGEGYFYVDTTDKEFTTEDMISVKESCYYLGECIRESIRYYNEVPRLRLLKKPLRMKIIKYASETREPVLMTGETGVGKGYIAEIIHNITGRTGKFVNVNIAGIPEGLIESEIFGYKKGAFTGAEKDMKGYIEEAEGGTLFLDEIGDLDFRSQAKLLKVIDERKYMRLGDTKERECDVRFIFATNRNLKALVRAKKFRKDLYHRISTFWIEVPPLRERIDMIEGLISEYESDLRGKRFSRRAIDFMKRYSWGGNVRELVGMLKRVGVEVEGEEIGIVDVVEALKNHLNKEELKGIIEEMRIEKECKDIYDRLNDIPAEEEKGAYLLNKNTKMIIKEIERGGNFWDSAWKRFIEREINREEIQKILKHYYQKSSYSYKRMIEMMNMDKKDYKKFLIYLKRYELIKEK